MWLQSENQKQRLIQVYFLSDYLKGHAYPIYKQSR